MVVQWAAATVRRVVPLHDIADFPCIVCFHGAIDTETWVFSSFGFSVFFHLKEINNHNRHVFAGIELSAFRDNDFV